MTNGLEKIFFDTFGIRAHYKYLLIDKTSRCHNEKLFDKTNFIDFIKSGKDYLLLKVIKYHPQITDRILLELLSIQSYEKSCYTLSPFDSIDELKTYLLDEFIEGYTYNLYDDKEYIKHQVQALFKEEK